MDVYAMEDNSDAMINANVYDDSTEDVVIEASQVPVIVPNPVDNLNDRELLVAVYKQQEQIGNQLNWLCENLAGVFGMVTAVSQNGGGIRGMMKMMKEMNNNG